MYTPINGYTKQMIIDTIYKNNNGNKSVETYVKHLYPKCLYKSKDGNKCAVGCFIPDEKYDSEMEKTGVVCHLLMANPNLKEDMPLCNTALTKLQQIHDNHDGKGDVRNMLKEWIDNNVKD